MSRGIKFRAWGKAENAYCEVTALNFSNGHLTAVDVKNDEYGVWYMLAPSECVLEQYTGFKDKNCKEIYEGDIVQLRWMRYAVVFDEQNGQFGLQYLPNGNEVCFARDIVRMAPFYSDNAAEVIGNIHENPGLLERVRS